MKIIKLIIKNAEIFDYEMLSQNLIIFLEFNKIIKNYFNWSIIQEIETRNDEIDLFRGNTIENKSLGYFMKYIGQNYILELFSPIVEEILNTKESFEIIEIKLQEKDNLLENQERLSKIAQKTLHRILDSMSYIPLNIRYFAQMLWNKAKSKFPNAKYSLLTGFFFLRFLSPIIAVPERNGITFKKIDPNSRRAFVLVSKTIQNIANRAQFKEQTMSFLNPLVSQYENKIKIFLDSLIDPFFLTKYQNQNVLIYSQTESNYEVCWGTDLYGEHFKIEKGKLQINSKLFLKFGDFFQISEAKYLNSLIKIFDFLQQSEIYQKILDLLNDDLTLQQKFKNVFL
ncbi:ras gtpase-activating protein [Anaeramoeba flamelloides]|uniref:Ras gtpase-activating protein n=1 Tax=Anaeramoeba flamelloides TaxID=1746091 RepID=A0ABQ8YEH3_9EUKA|nr:ras gtpase-activating protein [Anaeramoeba flamelloides]